MNLSLTDLVTLARDTVKDPREGARVVMRANVPMAARWAAFVLMAVGSAILAHLSFALMPPDARVIMAEAMASPIVSALMQAVLMLVAVMVIYGVGRWFGGQGRFEDALILMVWLQFILLILQVLQIAVQVLAPQAMALIGYGSVAIFLWLLSYFVAELHGFTSVVKTFFGILATLFALGFVLAFAVMPFLGVGV